MPPTGYTNLSVQTGALTALDKLTIGVSAALGRRVSRSAAIEIALELFAERRNNAQVVKIANRLDI